MTVYLIAAVCFLLANGITIIARSSNGEHTESLPHTIQCLTEKISEYQAKKDTRFFPPNYWSKTKGIYESDVKLYFHGKPVMTLVRHLFSIYDINMFATTWINYVLLEAHKFGKAPKPSPAEIDLSLDAIAKFTNKNLNYTNSVMTFWPQSYNDTEKVWQSAPQNLLSFFKVIDYIPWKLIEEAMKRLGLDALEKYIKQLLSQKDTYLMAFHIPPDFDDTFVNLALGSILTDMKSSFPKQHSTWLGHNSNITGIFDFLKQYAYRPFSKDRAVNSIDPRSYFYLRSFLEDAAKNGKDVALVPTWIQNIDEARQMQKKGVAMPFNINNIGCTVSANVIFGITSSILTGLLPPTILDDMEVEKIYRNTSSMLTWQLHTEMSKRPDLGLLYYPSLIEFYWFVSRTSSALERYAISGHLPHKALEETRQQFGKVLRGHVTEHILSLATKDGSQLYFDDFMGDADISFFNKTTVKAEDRLFTTAAAVNALQGIWTLYNDTTKQNYWIHGTPQNVIDTVMLAVSFLQKNILGYRYKPWNAFYSGSVKGLSTLPFVYPINRYENNSRGEFFLIAMEGVISEEEYLKKTKIPNPYFGNMTTPMEFHGFNSDPGMFPYWNSVPYTYATALLALSQFQNTKRVDVNLQPRLKQ